jgi:hypothetical protein
MHLAICVECGSKYGQLLLIATILSTHWYEIRFKIKYQLEKMFDEAFPFPSVYCAAYDLYIYQG